MEQSAQAMPSSLANFYGSVVQDVIHSLHADFEADGVDESVVDELQTLWETKLKNANVLPADYRRPVPSHELTLNANPVYEGEGWTPTVVNVFPETPGIVNVPGFMNAPGIVNTSVQGHVSTESTPLMSINGKHGNSSYHGQRPLAGDNLGHSLDFMPPFLMSRGINLFDVNKVYVETGEGMYRYPQNEPPETKDYIDLSSIDNRKRDYYSSFPQLDGAGDVDRLSILHVKKEDYNVPGEEEPPYVFDHDIKPVKVEVIDSEGAQPAYVFDRDIKPVKVEVMDAVKVEVIDSEEAEPPLNEEDDVEDVAEEDEEPKTDNLVVAQFEKVTKVKGKWKCILKDGIVRLNEKEYVFSKANGEFDFNIQTEKPIA